MKITQDQAIARFKTVHGDRYDYSKVIYIRSIYRIEIICKIHGSFMQFPQHHYRGSNCPKCSWVGLGRSKRMNTKDIVKQFTAKHGSRYDYSKVNYVKDNEKVEIICLAHGSFFQVPMAHKKGQGCPDCGNLTDKIRDAFVRLCNGSANLYIIKCFGDSEVFYKVGVTSKPLNIRFKDEKRMPYRYEVILFISGDPSSMWDKEKSIHRNLYSFLYLPKNQFKGSKTECFTNIDLIQEFINENT